MAIDDEIDLVVASDRCAVLALAAFTTLFGDVGIAFQQIPQNVAAMSDALEGTFPLSQASIDALSERCGRRVIDAKRLHHIVTERHDALRDVTKARMTTLLEERGLKDAISDDGLALTKDTVSDFLDLVEGRLFSDDVTGEERRADAYSPRSQ